MDIGEASLQIIVYVIDALRADHVSAYGYGRDTTPNLDRLAADGVLYRHCFAPATWTRPVAASLLTGYYPGVHGVDRLTDVLSPDIPTLAEALKGAGFTTAAFSAAGNVSPVLGFGRGFDYYDALYRSEALLATRKQATSQDSKLKELGAEEIVLPLAEDVNQSFFRWLEQTETRNWFSLLWVLDVHAPYDPPQPFRRYSGTDAAKPSDTLRSLRYVQNENDLLPLIDLYDDEISYVDNCLGQLIERLKTSGNYDDAMVIVTSDHGEAFLEHGTAGHGHLPYDELLHVPLIIKFPHSAFAGNECGGLTWLGDITATILDSVGSVDVSLQGRSTLPMLRNEVEQIHEAVYSQTAISGMSRYWYSARTERWKYLVTGQGGDNASAGTRYTRLAKALFQQQRWRHVLLHPRRYLKLMRGNDPVQLYDLLKDEEEKINLASPESEVLSQMVAVLESWQLECTRIADQLSVERGALDLDADEELQAHLRALGYVD